ncbi:MAG: class I SAM-dependent methyltransferase [Pseudotabrizicola sp.]|uniref:class I SAM-dependent DNA methyltransferase n=1 Tax=Pseudotabrizicola sp. TaxID=2939647 RepID=UPI0027322273|nr:class I SAM-dependent methyltransferase [Pseudotabrizicola sp.]MDP2081275.1 class I SAM-dependent methyltransferase [Pseudotabrizicola sp.]MDZ7576106.1 class I SAM-dependent methyltransferase [Pseudotabrizicola sp.]
MSDGQHDGHLGKVYDAQAPEQVAAVYDTWAASYDAEMAAAGYRHPSIGCALLFRHAPRGAGPVLDAGCGTGLLGDWLGILGFAPVEGLDLSAGMLAVARAKGSYARLHQLALGQPLPFADGQFAAVISTGVFTTGHVGAEALPELIRITHSGGPLVLTVKTTLWAGGFSAVLNATAGITVVETTAPYVSMPGEAGTIPSLAVVIRRG